MKIWLKTAILAFLILLAGLYFVSKAQAAIIFSEINVTNIENGSARIHWETDIRTKGTIYYGESEKILNHITGYSLYGYDHELVVTGLEKNKTYLFKILASNNLETPAKEESFLQSFSTKNMKDIIAPVFSEKAIIDSVSDSIVFKWVTNEETNAPIFYREESEESFRATGGYRDFARYHEKIIGGLKQGKRYYIKIAATDRSGNKSFEYLSASTLSGNAPDLRISDIGPLSFDEKVVLPRSITLRWKTNRVTFGSVSYGKNLNKLSEMASDPSYDRKTGHEVRLINLDPLSTYYYRITATDAFNKQVRSEILSFTTPAPRVYLQNGSVVKGKGYKVYVIDGKTRRWIKTADIFVKLGYRQNWIEKVDDALLNEYREEAPLIHAKSHPNGTLIKYSGSPAVYLLENGKKRPFSSAQSFLRLGYDWNRIIIIPGHEVYKTGEYL